MIVLAVVYWRQHGNPLDPEPGVIEKPVYLEVRLEFEGKGRSIETVALAETADEADCQRFAGRVIPYLEKRAGDIKGVNFRIKSQECKTELSARYKGMFNNEPDRVTYLRAARGAPAERESRFIYWGVSVDESDKVCDLATHIQKHWSGEVSCVRAFRS